ncbi:MAG: hypothetical protein ACTSVM_07435 [Candidatus Ranarchaeia archaeon]
MPTAKTNKQKKHEPQIIDAVEQGKPLRYYVLNQRIHDAINAGYSDIIVDNVLGQRFIAAGIKGDIRLTINGTPGNDLGVFMDGPTIIVNGSAEDQTGNTMNSGKIVVHGNSWDVTGLASRGGTILAKGNGGYRIGIHMKEYGSMIPVIAYCGRVRQFFGEYMAGGILIALGMDLTKSPPEEYPQKEVVHGSLGSGIHGGTIYIRGKVDPELLGVGARIDEFSEEDKDRIAPIIDELNTNFGLPIKQVWEKEFTKIVPGSHRPYAKYYTYVQI